jgi:hypothetical protein
VFGFDKWHLSTFKERSYAQCIVKYLNDNIINKKYDMVEIGCGLGDIIRNIRIKNKLGLDADIKVLKAARILSSLRGKFRINYKVFVFPTSQLDGFYDIIIMVNWIHNVEPKELKTKMNEYFMTNLRPNGVLIMDTVQDKEYKYNHSVDFLMSDMRAQKIKIGEFERQREVYAIRKV